MPSDRNASDFRLRKHAEYQRVYKAARKKHGKLLAYFFAQRPPLAQDPSHGDTASKPTAQQATEQQASAQQASAQQASAQQPSAQQPSTHQRVAGLPPDGPRIGLTVPKALGKAVVRNRIKRRMRAAVRSCIPLLSSPMDVILHPRRSVEDCPFAALEQEVSTIFRAVQASQRSAPSSPRALEPREQTRKEARPSQGKIGARPQVKP